MAIEYSIKKFSLEDTSNAIKELLKSHPEMDNKKVFNKIKKMGFVEKDTLLCKCNKVFKKDKDKKIKGRLCCNECYSLLKKKRGRPATLDRRLVKTPRNVKLPEWMWNWIDDQEVSRALVIEAAITRCYGINQNKYFTEGKKK